MADRTLWRRRLAVALFLLTWAGFGFGIWAHYPLLRAEFERLPAWQLALLCTADVVSLGLFLLGLLRYCTETPATSDPRSRAYQKQVLRLYLVGFAIPWLVDLGASIALSRVEQADFRRAAIAVGEVRQVEKWEAWRGTCKHRYHLHCCFRDAAGAQHETVQIICTDEHGEFEGGLAPGVKESLRRGQAPFAIRIAYLPEAPYQAWLADLGPGYGWDLHWFSLQILICQGGMIFVLVFGPLLTNAERGSVVEAREDIASIPLCLKEAVPMMIEASMVALMGFFELYTFRRVL